MVSKASAVPAAEVIEREDVLGIQIPKLATIGTIIGVIRLPGRPPAECLTATIF